jgi:Kinetochore complex Fta4 of Sim4 subunit, or CENP-50
VNAQLRRHAQETYPSQALRHVAEQIDVLYLNTASAVIRAEAGGVDDDVLQKDTDYRRKENIEALPEEWPLSASTQETSNLDEQYAAKVARLQELSTRLQASQARRAQLQQLRSLLEPFESPAENVQPHLVTRDGELQKELDRMRILMARVGGRVVGLKDLDDGDGDDMVQDTTMEGNRKLDDILGLGKG